MNAGGALVLYEAARRALAKAHRVDEAKSSEKPERRRIERLFAGPYLELYARRSVPAGPHGPTKFPHKMRRLNDAHASPKKGLRRGVSRAYGQYPMECGHGHRGQNQ
jgi:hypothetical protein